MKRETFDLLLGLSVMALGIGLLLFTFGNALALVASPGQFIRNQTPSLQQQLRGPSASFTWSSSGFNLTVQDTSHAGSNSITTWQWVFGDNSGTVTGQHPTVHVYADAGLYNVFLTVTDASNLNSTTFSPVDVVPAQPRNGVSVGDVSASYSNLLSNFNFGDLLVPVGVGVLTVGLYMAMAVVGGMITKAGWNLIRPRPETIRIRLKPQHLQQMIEADSGSSTAPPPPPQGP